jgi:uncharacterized protein YceK
MKVSRAIWAVVALGILAQGCATVSSKKVAVKQKKTLTDYNESFALWDEKDDIDAKMVDLNKKGSRSKGY